MPGMTSVPCSDRLAALRSELERAGVDGFIVPRADEYQGEYVPPCASRLEWLSGFSGSAGVALVLADRAAVLSDGRYTLQLRAQVDPALYETGDSTKTGAGDWLALNAGRGAVIGYDPWLHTPFQIRALEDKLKAAGMTLRALERNPLDAVWSDRPAPPMEAVSVYPERLAGRSGQDKRREIAEGLRKQGAFAAILTLPDSIAWLLNIRGGDVEHIPVALSYAVIRAQNGAVEWFIAPEKIPEAVHRHVGPEVQVTGPHAVAHEIGALAGQAAKAGQPVLLDGRRSPVWFRAALEKGGAQVLDATDPCIAPKACKTPAEQAAMTESHRRDGLALTRFLAWLDREAPGGGQSELSIGERLEQFRREDPSWRDSSFDTICGFGPNGAIVHYRADENSSLPVRAPGLLLVDSGAQYEDGTTDVTRTVAIGEPGAAMKKHFTLVLKGHISVASARFPEGTTGAQIDALARKALWDEGLDYAHGTGHGVGCYLSVHEEAASISPRGQEPLKAGMVLSNEPGYYEEGAYGIRIENLVLVEDTGVKNHTGAAMLAFRTLTLAPVDLRLVDPAMLSEAEKEWLNAYHAAVRAAHEAALPPGDRDWLARATEGL